MDYTALILALINVTPGLVTALERWFEENPRLADETDEAYATRLNARTLQTAADTTTTDASVIGSTQTG